MIAVEAHVLAESAGFRLRIDGRGSVLTCRLDGYPANFFETLRRSRYLLAAIRAALPLFVRCGIRLEIRVGNVRIGRAGSGIEQNALGRMLRLPAVHLGR